MTLVSAVVAEMAMWMSELCIGVRDGRVSLLEWRRLVNTLGFAGLVKVPLPL